MISIYLPLILAFCCRINAADDLIVQLPYGKIRGHTQTSYQGNPYYAFQEVPYAAPPVGINRFQAPKDPIPWTGIRNTTKNNVICYQARNDHHTDLNNDEDCLFLNVYSSVKPGSKERLPVMIFIHGGGFQTGSGAYQYMAPTFLIDHGIVIVVINYRLGPFGFLSTLDDTISGNAGLKDQHKAIEWVHDNIGLFGGDNTRVTLAGQSAGSMSVSLHLLGPWRNNKVLYQAAIMESHNELFEGTVDNHRSEAFRIGRSVNKTFISNNTKELLDILQRANPDDLLKVSGSPMTVIEKEGPYSYHPYKSLATGNFKKVPIIMGFDSEEALWWTLFNLTAMILPLDRDPSIMFTGQFNMSKVNRTIAGYQIRKLYTNSTFLDNVGGYIRFRSDLDVVSPVCREAQLRSKYSNVYLYEFSYKGKLGIPPNITIPHIEGTDSVAHGEELGYMWDDHTNTNLSKFPADDRLTSQRMVKLFTNFVQFHNPTPAVDSLFENTLWPTVDPNQPGNLQYLNINKTLGIRSNPRKYQEMFQIIDRYITPNDII